MLIGLLISLLDTQVPRAEYALCFTAGRAGAGVWAGAACPRGCPVPAGLLQPHPFPVTQLGDRALPQQLRQRVDCSCIPQSSPPSMRNRNCTAHTCNEFDGSQFCSRARWYPTNPALMGLTKRSGRTKGKKPEFLQGSSQHTGIDALCVDEMAP